MTAWAPTRRAAAPVRTLTRGQFERMAPRQRRQRLSLLLAAVQAAKAEHRRRWPLVFGAPPRPRPPRPRIEPPPYRDDDPGWAREPCDNGWATHARDATGRFKAAAS